MPSRGTTSPWSPADARAQAAWVDDTCSPESSKSTKNKKKLEEQLVLQAACKAEHSTSGETSGESATPASTEQVVGTQQTMTAMAGTTPPDVDGCTGPGVVCAWDEVHHFVFEELDINSAGETITATTSDLKSISGSTPDTVIFLLRCSDSTCTDGQVVASDDDHNTATTQGAYDHLDSTLSHVTTAAGRYRVIVSSYVHGREGTTDIEIKVGSTIVYQADDTVFGGWHVRSHELRDGDRIYVGKNANDPPTVGLQAEPYTDSVLLVMNTMDVDCDSGACGQFQMNDDVSWGTSTVLVSGLEIDGAAGSVSRVLVGTYHGSTTVPGYVLNARLIHARHHTADGGMWPDSGQLDRDGDGLTREVEIELGTCDDYTSHGVDVGFEGANCAAIKTMVNTMVQDNDSAITCAGQSGDPAKCWSPVDSDNDGLRDSWEVWAGAVSCTKVPALPTNDAGTCTPMDLLGTCTGAWCVGDTVSAMSKPDPTVFDIYARLDQLGCDLSTPFCAALHIASDPQMSHGVTAEQEDQLLKFWTEEPATCWDGSTDPTRCVHPQDRRYRVAFHLRPAQTWRVPDDAYGWEIQPDVDETYSYFDRNFGGLLRYAQVGIYGLLTHGSGGGQAGEGSPHIIVGNRRLADTAAMREEAIFVLSHETGHTLGLSHPHGGRSVASCQSNMPSCGTVCTQLDTDCNVSCPKGCGNWQDVNVASVMSYSFGRHGMGLKSSSAPSQYVPRDDYCEPLAARFSKGLHLDLNEASLNETWAESYQAIMMAQAMKCYDGFNDFVDIGPFGFRTPTVPGQPPMLCFASSYFGPFCDGTSCYFNWNSDSAYLASTTPYALDLSDDNRDGVGGCADDVLRDRDEWGSIIALSRSARKAGHKTYKGEHRIFSAHFNGGQVANLAAWDNAELPVQVNGATLSDARSYPYAGCLDSSDCGGSACVSDACAVDDDCSLGQTCSGGACTCSLDQQCVSEVCLANNTCAAGWGQCACASNTCSSPLGDECTAPSGHCLPMKASDDPNTSSAEQSPKNSLHFDGVNDDMVLSHSGFTSPLVGVGVRESYELGIELRFDGFATGESRQVIMSTGGGAMELSVESLLNFTVLKAKMGSSVLTYLITPGIWYRVRWAAHVGDQRHVLSVLAWNVVTGRYVQSYCTKDSSFSGPLNISTDVRFGHDGGANSDYFAGRLDNVQLSNYWIPMEGDQEPAGCVEVGP